MNSLGGGSIEMVEMKKNASVESQLRQEREKNKKLNERILQLENELKEERKGTGRKNNSASGRFFMATTPAAGAPPNSMRQSAFIVQEVKEEVVATAVAKHSYDGGSEKSVSE